MPADGTSGCPILLTVTRHVPFKGQLSVKVQHFLEYTEVAEDGSRSAGGHEAPLVSPTNGSGLQGGSGN